MSFADDVRSYCGRAYVEPARANGQAELKIRAGDVHSALGYKSRMPLVCSAIGSDKFPAQYGLRRIAIDGPVNGANTSFRFALDR